MGEHRPGPRRPPIWQALIVGLLLMLAVAAIMYLLIGAMAEPIDHATPGMYVSTIGYPPVR